VETLAGNLKPIETYRALFPVVTSKVWLNHASQGTLSTPVRAALARFEEEHAMGDFSGESEEELYARVRRTVAEFINANPGEIAFTKNVPDGLNIVAHGLSWEAGDRIVIPDQEFPANVYPWLNLASKGVETIMVPSREGAVPLEALIDAIDDRTRIVSVSWVEFSTGYRNDLRSLADACHEKGALFCVDAIQGLGALQFDVRELDIDIMATSSHKWLLGPTGAGWMYCREDLVDELSVCFIGQSSVQRFNFGSYLDFHLPLWHDARKFEPGIHNMLGLIGLEAALGLFSEVGMSRVESRVKALSDLVALGLSDRGYGIVGTREGNQWSGIVSFESGRFEARDIYSALLAAGVFVSLREPVVRVSTHFYNDEEDVSRLFAALP
jgi:selenocysteine lyase/cysteine desulfurase